MTTFKQILKPIRIQRLVTFFFQLLSILFSLSQPILIGNLIDQISQINQGGRMDAIYHTIFLLVLVSILDFLIYYTKDFFFQQTLAKGIMLMRYHVMSAALGEPLSSFNHQENGDKLNKILNDSETYAKYLVYLIPETIIFMTRLLIIYSIFFVTSFELTVIIFGIFVAYTCIYLALNKSIKPRIQTESESYSKVMEDTVELLQGRETIKLGLKDTFFKRRFQDSLNRYLVSKTQVLRVSSLDSAFMNFFYSIIPITILGVGVFLVLQGKLTLGSLFTLQSYTHWILDPVFSITTLNRLKQQADVALPRLQEFFKHEESVERPVLKQKLSRIQTLELQKVCFAYESNQNMIQELDLRLEVGSRLAVVGQTGSGKSTLSKLLLGILHPTSGHILVNGQNLFDFETEDLLVRISYLPQDVFLFAAGVRENIQFDQGWELSEQVIAGLHLEDLLGREVDSKHSLSGGERQRIGIARSLNRSVDVLIYDEPTSALDQATEDSVVATIASYLDENPAIFIAITHRKKILEICNQQLELTGGGSWQLSSI
ncbi:ABC transporter ATP-binding protein [Streptococcus suis]|uniref:ABC transporter ATP-binding protein n=1 Tax=Streptococcus suivaginalis TaxID=3028082 RepID=A0AA96VBA5_9STRE|nr:ABC transporter ATP-binding protein [Streptococcus sp. 29896]MCK4028442.1 ABC transporter ATP-binding protein [Streptococcus suis]WNY46555.1 ABC transporter ATP-binding protein [Streptococcus sp. 29896]